MSWTNLPLDATCDLAPSEVLYGLEFDTLLYSGYVGTGAGWTSSVLDCGLADDDWENVTLESACDLEDAGWSAVPMTSPCDPGNLLATPEGDIVLTPEGKSIELENP